MLRPAIACPGPLTRRHFLKIGSLTLGSVGLGGLLPLQLRATETGRPLPILPYGEPIAELI